MELFQIIMAIIVAVLLIIQTTRLINAFADRDRWRRAAELLAAGWTEENNKYFVMKYADGALLKWAKDKACNAADEATKEGDTK